MTAFFDTSALLKKYIAIETSYAELEVLLQSAEQIMVAPTFVLEAYSAIERRFREKDISGEQRSILKKAVKEDLVSVIQIDFTQELQEMALELLQRHPISALDSIQLASALVAQPDLFVTSDRQLSKYARKELQHVQLI